MQLLLDLQFHHIQHVTFIVGVSIHDFAPNRSTLFLKSFLEKTTFGVYQFSDVATELV